MRDHQESGGHPDIATQVLNSQMLPNNENLSVINVYDAPDAMNALTVKMAGTPQAVRYYLAFKCVTQGNGISTADQINASLKHHFADK